MPINSALFDRLQKKLDVSPRHVHRLIERAALRNHLPRGLAALLVASEHNIPVHRYATDEELAELRGLRGGVAPVAPVAALPGPSRRTISAKAPKPTRNNSIFVVHGRDTKLTDDMYSFLRAIGIYPMEWNEAIKAAKGGANPIVGDVINQAMKSVQGVLVLLAPDEDAKLKSKFAKDKDKKKGLHVLDGQPRPNVIFEAGLALGAHSEKTILVQVGDIREISDIAGKHMVQLSNAPASRKTLALRLRDKLKFKINIDGDQWLEVGDFDR
jgi:predicted nucleotide-binding protein